MTTRRHRLLLLGVLAAALAARVAAFLMHPDIYPDAFFQYLEPAWWKLHGYGWLAWEWAPSVGLRSWVPPGYYGTWMVLLGWLGVRDPATLYDFFALHWCALSLLLVVAAHRIGRALAPPSRAEEGGLVAALAVAVCPTIAYFTPQTLIDSSVLIPFGLGFADWIEAVGAPKRGGALKVLAAGAWLGLGSCLRIPYAPLAVLVGMDFLARGRLRQTLLLGLGAAIPILSFGAVDWLTWGAPFHSTVAFINYNFVQGRAAEHGVAPWHWYLTEIARRGGIFLALSLPLVAVEWRRAWKPAALAIAVVAYLSTQAHKEERFVLVFWPLWCAAFGAAAAGLIERTSGRRALRVGARIAVLAAVGLCAVQGIDSFRGEKKRDYSDLWGLYEGQTYVGRQEDATGVLLFGRPHLNGGAFRTGKNIAFAPYSAASLGLPLFNYAVVPEAGPQSRALGARGFRRVAVFGGFAVYKRPTP
jgi:GPI mannosyltransferase 3